jgi:DNA-binding response OmpR family regulator
MRREVPMAERATRVLVVEDDQVIRDTIADALDLEGYEARVAMDGEEALDVLEGWVPDLIILDLMMPRMDAWRFRREQRARPTVAEVPILVLSAGRDLPEKTRELDPAAIIPKPFDLDDLTRTIRELTSPSRRARPDPG